MFIWIPYRPHLKMVEYSPDVFLAIHEVPLSAALPKLFSAAACLRLEAVDRTANVDMPRLASKCKSSSDASASSNKNCQNSL